MPFSNPKDPPSISFYFADITHFSPTGVLELCKPFIKSVYISTECNDCGPLPGPNIIMHRDCIAQWCKSQERAIVVHHPWDIIEVARTIAAQQDEGVVVVTASLEVEASRISDAMLNLGSSLIAVQVCSPGVYIVINGRVFPWYQCRRNPETGCFESL